MLPIDIQEKIAALKDQYQVTSAAKVQRQAQHQLLQQQRDSLSKEVAQTLHQVEVHEKASLALKDLIRVVSSENIEQIETLVNSAIKAVMPEKQITFKIASSVKRDLTEYEIQLIRPSSSTGSTESNGGGLLALIAFVLKVTFNVLCKKSPLLVLDESLSFVSEQYILPTSQLINQLAEEFGLTVLLVSHQPLFNEASTTSYLAQPQGGHTTLKRIK